MTAGQLAKRLSLTTGAVTSVIDRLEGQNIVYRITDPKDRRKVVVHANPKKLEECGKVYESIGKAFAKLLSNYSEEQLRFLVEYYEASVEITKDEIAKLHT